MFSALPLGGFDRRTYAVLPTPATRLIEVGDTLDFGDRRFQVIHTPGCSPGSIALLESASGVLFPGDTVYDGPLMTDAWHSSLDDYVHSMERLLALPVRTVRGGLFPSFERAVPGADPCLPGPAPRLKARRETVRACAVGMDFPSNGIFFLVSLLGKRPGHGCHAAHLAERTSACCRTVCTAAS